MERRCRAGRFAGEPLIFLLLRLMHPALLNRAHENEVFPSTGGEQRHRGQSRASPAALGPPEQRGKGPGLLGAAGGDAPWPPLVQTPWPDSKGSHWLSFYVSLLLNSSWRCSPGWGNVAQGQHGELGRGLAFQRTPAPQDPLQYMDRRTDSRGSDVLGPACVTVLGRRQGGIAAGRAVQTRSVQGHVQSCGACDRQRTSLSSPPFESLLQSYLRDSAAESAPKCTV